MATLTRPLPLICSNLDCPNKPGEGLFSLVTFEAGDQPGTGRRDVRLALCMPCANVVNPPPKAEDTPFDLPLRWPPSPSGTRP